ncbi:MAG: hypothetical protein HGA45_13145 [Chloroflexales bacterium]|nr:hypothetical protein [Chloroflexales bacterium]
MNADKKAQATRREALVQAQRKQRKQLKDDPRITFRRVRRIHVSSSAALAANADLEVFPPQRIWDISIVPGALSVIVGNGVGLTLPVESATVVPPLTGPQPVLATANDVVR